MNSKPAAGITQAAQRPQRRQGRALDQRQVSASPIIFQMNNADENVATNSGGGYADTVGAQALDNRGSASAPHAAGGDPYLNNVNQHANHAPHTDAMNTGNEYNPYHDSTGAQDGPLVRNLFTFNDF
jgi:hypothetical protein